MHITRPDPLTLVVVADIKCQLQGVARQERHILDVVRHSYDAELAGITQRGGFYLTGISRLSVHSPPGLTQENSPVYKHYLQVES